MYARRVEVVPVAVFGFLPTCAQTRAQEARGASCAGDADAWAARIARLQSGLIKDISTRDSATAFLRWYLDYCDFCDRNAKVIRTCTEIRPSFDELASLASGVLESVKRRYATDYAWDAIDARHRLAGLPIVLRGYVAHVQSDHPRVAVVEMSRRMPANPMDDDTRLWGAPLMYEKTRELQVLMPVGEEWGVGASITIVGSVVEDRRTYAGQAHNAKTLVVLPVRGSDTGNARERARELETKTAARAEQESARETHSAQLRAADQAMVASEAGLTREIGNLERALRSDVLQPCDNCSIAGASRKGTGTAPCIMCKGLGWILRREKHESFLQWYCDYVGLRSTKAQEIA